jgi:hypothetical protein
LKRPRPLHYIKSPRKSNAAMRAALPLSARTRPGRSRFLLLASQFYILSVFICVHLR